MRTLAKLFTAAILLTASSPSRAVIYTFSGTADVPGVSHSEQCYPPLPDTPGHCDPAGGGPIIEHVLGFAAFDSDNPSAIFAWTAPPFPSVDGYEYLGITSVGFDEWGNYLLQGMVTGHLDVPHFCPLLNCLHTVSDWGGAIELRQVTPQPVPEPGTWGMMLFGMGAIGGLLRRSRNRRFACEASFTSSKSFT